MKFVKASSINTQVLSCSGLKRSSEMVLVSVIVSGVLISRKEADVLPLRSVFISTATAGSVINATWLLPQS